MPARHRKTHVAPQAAIFKNAISCAVQSRRMPQKQPEQPVAQGTQSVTTETVGPSGVSDSATFSGLISLWQMRGPLCKWVTTLANCVITNRHWSADKALVPAARAFILGRALWGGVGGGTETTAKRPSGSARVCARVRFCDRCVRAHLLLLRNRRCRGRRAQ